MPQHIFRILVLQVLIVFAVLRPLTAIVFFGLDGPLGAINLREIFGLTISYILLVSIFLNAQRVRIGFAELSILSFLTYLGLSVLWGSEVRELSRLILPAVIFFAVKLAINEEKAVNLVLILLMAGFFLPLTGSSGLILSGRGLDFTSYWTGINRYQGLYSGSHALAHQMFIFLTISAVYLALSKQLTAKKNLFVYFIYSLSFFAIFNIYKTHTRTVYLGFITLGGLYLFGRKRYGLLVVAMLSMLGILVFSPEFQKTFWDVIEPLQGKQDIGVMGSGRIGLWSKAMTMFSGMPFERYFLGIGVGREIKGTESFFGASHNDLLSLLISVGVIGLLLYLWMIYTFLFDIVRSNLDKSIKYVFLGFLIAVMGMNFASNSYISRFELAQYFFLIMGIFYALRNALSEKNKEEIPKP